MRALFVGIFVMFVFGSFLFCAYDFGQTAAEKEIKRKCEIFGVVDLPITKSIFYCARKPPEMNEAK